MPFWESLEGGFGSVLGASYQNSFRFAIPAEALGGLDAWRFGRSEAWGMN